MTAVSFLKSFRRSYDYLPTLARSLHKLSSKIYPNQAQLLAFEIRYPPPEVFVQFFAEGKKHLFHARNFASKYLIPGQPCH